MGETGNKPNSEIFARLRDKDAEIAELRSQIEKCRDELAFQITNASYLIETCITERDEARECVKRLCEALREIDTESPREEPAAVESDAGDHGIRVGMYSLAVISRAALAATPEHLR